MRDLESIRPSDEAIDAEFDARRRESVFQEVVQARTAVAPISRSRRRWPAMAAAAVAGLAVLGLAAQALVTLDGQSVAEPPVAGATASSSTTLTSPGSQPSPRYVTVAAMLGPVAVAAAAAPVAEPDAFLHVVRVEEQHNVAGHGSSQAPTAADSSVTFDDYIDRDGWLWSRRTGDQQFWLLTGQDQSTITALPTDPNELDAALRSGTGNNSADERVSKGIHEILLTETAPPALRAAAITVLQRIAEHPQAAVTTKDGETATPTLVVTTVDLDGATGYRAAMTDPTSRPGVERWLVLDATGQIVESGTLSPDVSFSSRITTREWVDALPSDFVDVLGMEHVERDING